ncbi:MAG: 4a-hydroxytetrahydrobiopterin dehydratase [Ignavibacteriae bacterium]|nr:4a-hydroxytetrahydrobiopterin dehydratase [Ignavibacteriota bacterium]
MSRILLTEDQIQQRLKELNGWERAGKEIKKTVKRKDFVQAMGFVTSVSILAEKMDHHPDIDIRWNTVHLTLSTHSSGGLTEYDFNLAKQIDEL